MNKQNKYDKFYLDIASRVAESSVGSTLYLTLSPCINCALGIISAGIVKVVYEEPYKDLSGVKMLKGFGIETLWSEMVY